jgi:hypothetical protein
MGWRCELKATPRGEAVLESFPDVGKRSWSETDHAALMAAGKAGAIVDLAVIYEEHGIGIGYAAGLCEAYDFRFTFDADLAGADADWTFDLEHSALRKISMAGLFEVDLGGGDHGYSSPRHDPQGMVLSALDSHDGRIYAAVNPDAKARQVYANKSFQLSFQGDGEWRSARFDDLDEALAAATRYLETGQEPAGTETIDQRQAAASKP